MNFYKHPLRSAALIASMIISASSYADVLHGQAKAIFGTLPAAMPGSENDTPEMIELGRALYFDKRLSVNDSQSCNSCHDVENKGTGVDNKRVSPGAIAGKEGTRNSPTVWNAGFQVSQFWDGRAKDLKAQAKGPILNPVEMAMPSEQAVIDKLAATADYPSLFEAAFKADDALNYDNLAHAIAAFERTLITRDRFDQYLNGDNNALSGQEKKGLQAFIGNGCIACHNGPALGGKMIQKMGLVNPYQNQTDQGLYEQTKVDSDKMRFKVSMLRDVARTAPYFHDGSIATLEEAVRQMAWLQLGKKLDDATVEDSSAFLKSLNHQ